MWHAMCIKIAMDNDESGSVRYHTNFRTRPWIRFQFREVLEGRAWMFRIVDGRYWDSRSRDMVFRVRSSKFMKNVEKIKI